MGRKRWKIYWFDSIWWSESIDSLVKTTIGSYVGSLCTWHAIRAALGFDFYTNSSLAVILKNESTRTAIIPREIPWSGFYSAPIWLPVILAVLTTVFPGRSSLGFGVHTDYEVTVALRVSRCIQYDQFAITFYCPTLMKNAWITSIPQIQPPSFQ